MSASIKYEKGLTKQTGTENQKFVLNLDASCGNYGTLHLFYFFFLLISLETKLRRINLHMETRYVFLLFYFTVGMQNIYQKACTKICLKINGGVKRC